MISLLEIAERTQKGRKMPEDAWNMSLFQKIQELAKKYDIPKYTADMPFLNLDDGLADRAFRAGLDLITEHGVYCTTTGRVLEFAGEEVEGAIRESPAELPVGRGPDARVIKQREIAGKEPLNVCPGHHSPFSEDLAPLVVKNFAQIPRADFIEGFNFVNVDGREIQGEPLEVYATRRQIGWMREGVRKAGRPGLAIVLYPINTGAVTLMSVLEPISGLQPGDGLLTSVLPDEKIEHDMLAAAIASQQCGVWRVSSSFSMLGGFCGGEDGAIIEGVAKALTAMICYRVYVNCTGVEHIRTAKGSATHPQPLSWARSVVNQALNRHSNIICMAWIASSSGPGTELNLLETAARAIEAVANGANLYAPRHLTPRMNAGQTPVQPELMIEVADAVIRAGMGRDGAAETLGSLARQLEGRDTERGYTIQECYDLVNHKPNSDFLQIYLKVKDYLHTLGLDFD